MNNDIEIISKKEAKDRGLKHYFTGKLCKYGHIATRLVSSSHCCECSKEYGNDYYTKNKDRIADRGRDYRAKNKNTIAERKREYQDKNKDKIAEYNKRHRAKNKDKIAMRDKEYQKQNKDKISERMKDYYNQNKDKIIHRVKNYSKKNPAPKFLRDSLNRMFGNWKGGREKMEKLHGYTFDQLVTRIEFQFKDGMSWENRSEWHIDHKKPIARFLEQGITDPKIVNALSNLRPMWASENLSKGAKFEL